MQKKKYSLNIFLAFLCFFMCVFSYSFKPLVKSSASGVAVTGYSSVLGDLKIDDNFNEEDYPVNAEDTSIKLIQIAESTGGELFVYIYQPSAMARQFELTTISISQTLYNNAKYVLYDLKLLNSDGVFSKYKVKNIELKADVVRYYDITEIHRKFDEEIDTQPDNGNIITEIACDVGKQWTVCTLNGEVYYECVETETILITDKYVGFVEYEDGFTLKSLHSDSGCQSHFVAFSTDHDIDRLLEADVSYISQTRSYYLDNEDVYSSLGTAVTNNITLTYTDSAEYNPSGWFTKYTYSWDRIQSIDDFISSTADVNMYKNTALNVYKKTVLNEEAISELSNMQWVLRFAETDFKKTEVKVGSSFMTGALLPAYTKIDETAVSDVTILRLKFETDGVVYNLGVIDNKSTGSGIADSFTEFIVETSDSFKSAMKIIGWVFLAVVVLLVLGILSPVLKLLVKGILAVLKAVWWIITSPIYLFKNKK